MASDLPTAIFLMGPTASGKTDLATELWQSLPCDIISVDSAQVFRDMDVGTAKPDRATLALYPHRLINLISPEESYSTARFRSDALAAMAEITAAGKVPLLVLHAANSRRYYAVIDVDDLMALLTAGVKP